jgi:hypothetical protein
MPFIKRRRTRSERAGHLVIAEELLASGVAIAIPKEWREACRSFDIKIAPPPDSCVWASRTGLVCYAIELRFFATQSGQTYPDFEIETSWDTEIVLESFDEPQPDHRFGGHFYQSTEILNPRIEDNRTLPRGRLVHGWLLATGISRIPDKYRDFAIVPFDLTARDQASGKVIEKVQAQLSVSPSKKRDSCTADRRNGLYDLDDTGRPTDPSVSEVSRLRHLELTAQKKNLNKENLKDRRELNVNGLMQWIARGLKGVPKSASS